MPVCLKKSLWGLPSELENYIYFIVRVLFLDYYHLDLSVTLDSDNKVSDIYILLRGINFGIISPQQSIPNNS